MPEPLPLARLAVMSVTAVTAGDLPPMNEPTGESVLGMGGEDGARSRSRGEVGGEVCCATVPPWGTHDTMAEIHASYRQKLSDTGRRGAAIAVRTCSCFVFAERTHSRSLRLITTRKLQSARQQIGRVLLPNLEWSAHPFLAGVEDDSDTLHPLSRITVLSVFN